MLQYDETEDGDDEEGAGGEEDGDHDSDDDPCASECLLNAFDLSVCPVMRSDSLFSSLLSRVGPHCLAAEP